MTERKIQVGDIVLNTHVEGRSDAPWVTFCNSLATDLSMYDAQAAALAGDYRILRYDRRGHGGSETPDGPYSWDQMVNDVVGLWDALGIEKSHYVGLSMGGMTGIGVSLKCPERVLSLSACDCRADAPEFFRDMWNTRQAGVVENGMASVVDMTLATWFTEARLAEGGDLIERVRAMILGTSVSGYVSCTEALKQLDYKRSLGDIKVSTQFIVGANDGPHPDEMATMSAVVPGSALHVIESAAHLSNMEQPEAFTGLIKAFLNEGGS